MPEEKASSARGALWTWNFFISPQMNTEGWPNVAKETAGKQWKNTRQTKRFGKQNLPLKRQKEWQKAKDVYYFLVASSKPTDGSVSSISWLRATPDMPHV